MSINTLEYAAIFMQELDSQMVECSTTGWMEDNGKQVQYSGGARSENSQNGNEWFGKL